MEKKFSELGINDSMITGLKKQGIQEPTEIQSLAIPKILEGRDIIARSETGTGKTLAYLLPVFMKIAPGERCTQGIVLTPTHELAVQVYKQAKLLSENSGIGIQCALIIGGASVSRQLEKLKEKPQLVVGSPGRILELIQKKKITAHKVKIIVIDEADRLLDSRNIEGVQAVIKTTLRERQLLLFSASIDKNTQIAGEAFLKEPYVVSSVHTLRLPTALKHFYIGSERREKVLVLRKLLHMAEMKKALVFINNPENIQVIVDKLCYHDIKAAGLYGGALKAERRIAMEAFREGRANVLVASEIGARGLDIPGVTHVINLDIPEEASGYLHRAGRAGRMGKDGTVISIATPGEIYRLKKHSKALQIVLTEKEMLYGKLSDPKKEKKQIKEEASIQKETIGKIRGKFKK